MLNKMKSSFQSSGIFPADLRALYHLIAQVFEACQKALLEHIQKKGSPGGI